MRAVGLDLGSRRIGVAVSDAEGRMAVPLETVPRSGEWARDHARIAELVDEAEAEMVVVGLPLSLDGSEGPAARKIRTELKFIERSVRVPVATYDERLSTVEAEASLRSARVAPGRRRQVIDAAAAAVILQGWLDHRRGGLAAADDDTATDDTATDDTADDDEGRS